MSSIFLKDIGCDYNCKRNKIITDLKASYERTLKEYTNIYRQYMSFRYDTSINRGWKRSYAEKSIRPTLVRLNSVMNDALNRLKQMYDESRQNIERNDSTLMQKTKQLLEKNQQINEQATFIQDKYAELKSKEQQIIWNKTKNQYKRRIMNFLLLANFVLLLGIGFTFFLGTKPSITVAAVATEAASETIGEVASAAIEAAPAIV